MRLRAELMTRTIASWRAIIDDDGEDQLTVRDQDGPSIISSFFLCTC